MKVTAGVQLPAGATRLSFMQGGDQIAYAARDTAGARQIFSSLLTLAQSINQRTMAGSAMADALMA